MLMLPEPDDEERGRHKALMKKTGLKEEELEFWNTVQSKIYLREKRVPTCWSSLKDISS